MRKIRLFAGSALLIVCVLAAGCGSGGEEGEGQSAPTTQVPGRSSSDTAQANLPQAFPPRTEQPQSVVENPEVLVTTSMGPITIELLEDKSPETVRNFLKYVDSGHYDQTIFHRVYKGQAIQGGAFTADGQEKPAGVPILNEADNGLKNRRYTVAMVRQPDSKTSATCQFFINLADNPMLDHRDGSHQGYGYCVFGNVIQGTEVVDQIGNVPTHHTDKFDQTPVEVVRIESVRRLR